MKPHCVGHDPREWDGLGTTRAMQICGDCPIRPTCLEQAIAEKPIDQMRAGYAFDNRGKVIRHRHARVSAERQRAREDFWHRLAELGIPTTVIAERCHVRYTTVVDGIAAAERTTRRSA